MVNEALINAGNNSGKFSEEDILATENGSDPYNHSYTNYLDEVYKQNYITQHTLNLNGGTETGRYLLSFDYLDQPGITETLNTNVITTVSIQISILENDKGKQ